MTSYSDTVGATCGVADTEEATATTIKIPGGTTIKEIKIANTLGTGIIYQVRVDFPGMKTPQTYLLNQTTALEGTEVGSGKVLNLPISVDIPVPSNVSEVKFYTKCSVNSQTYILGVKWEGP